MNYIETKLSKFHMMLEKSGGKKSSTAVRRIFLTYFWVHFEQREIHTIRFDSDSIADFLTSWLIRSEVDIISWYFYVCIGMHSSLGCAVVLSVEEIMSIVVIVLLFIFPFFVFYFMINEIFWVAVVEWVESVKFLNEFNSCLTIYSVVRNEIVVFSLPSIFNVLCNRKTRIEHNNNELTNLNKESNQVFESRITS